MALPIITAQKMNKSYGKSKAKGAKKPAAKKGMPAAFLKNMKKKKK